MIEYRGNDTPLLFALLCIYHDGRPLLYAALLGFQKALSLYMSCSSCVTTWYLNTLYCGCANNVCVDVSLCCLYDAYHRWKFWLY